MGTGVILYYWHQDRVLFMLHQTFSDRREGFLGKSGIMWQMHMVKVIAVLIGDRRDDSVNQYLRGIFSRKKQAVDYRFSRLKGCVQLLHNSGLIDIRERPLSV